MSPALGVNSLKWVAGMAVGRHRAWRGCLGGAGSHTMNKLRLIFLGGVAAFGPSLVSADVTNVRCHLPEKQRSETDLEIVFDTDTKQVVKFAFWDDLQTLFWSDDVIYWLAKGDYSETNPQFSLSGYHIQTSQLLSYVLAPSDFGTDIIAKMSRSERPPWNCYRVGL